MKKTICPFSFFYVSTMTLFLAVALISLYAVILCVYELLAFNTYVLIIPMVAGLAGSTLFGYVFICNVFNKMTLTDKGIAVTGQKMKGGIQLKEFIDFDEIKNVKLICAHMNSKGKKINIVGIASMRPHVFLEFVLQNEMSKFIYIEIYSVKQRKKILKIVNQMTNLDFSYKQLEKKDQSIFRKTKNKS